MSIDVSHDTGGRAAPPGLKQGALGRVESAVMGVAGVAPAYSIAASTGALVAAVGLDGAGALLYCGIAMFGIVWAYNELGRGEVNAGAAYAWVRRAIHPSVGYLCGWALFVSALLFMVAGSFPAGSSFLGLFSARLANDVAWVTVFGAVFFLLMVVLVTKGVTVTATAQLVMSGVEITLLVVFGVLAIVQGVTHPVNAFHWSWLSPTSFHGFSAFIAGALVAAFYYWGWDVTANLNEETREASSTAGFGATAGLLMAFVLFLVFTVATDMVLSVHAIGANSGDVLDAVGQKVWPGVGGKVLIVAVLLSTVATLETTLIQVTRTLYVMGRDRTMPAVLGRLHPRWQTPWVSSVVVAVLSLALFVGSNFIGSVGRILGDAINAIGLQITFYYGFAGLAAVILAGRRCFGSTRSLLLLGAWPALGAAFMFVMFVESLLNLGATTIVVGLGALAIGLVPLAFAWASGAPYFDRRAPIEVAA
jgi:amino acid transporter